MQAQSSERSERQKPAPGSRAASRQEQPLPPETIAGLRTGAASAHMTGTGCGVTVGVVAAVCLALSLARLLPVEPVVVLFSGLMAMPLAVHLMRSGEGQLLADAEAGISVRLVGPVTLHAVDHEESATTYAFVLLDEEFPIGLSTFLQLAKDEWAEVDYLPHSRRILALRNGKGTLISAYQHTSAQ